MDELPYHPLPYDEEACEKTFRHAFSFSELKQKQSLVSPIFYARNLPWTIKINRERSSKENTIDRQTYLAAYLCLNIESDSSTWFVGAKFRIRVLPMGWSCEEHSVFSVKVKASGTGSLVYWVDLVNPVLGIVEDDKITLEVWLSVKEPHGVDFGSIGSDDISVQAEICRKAIQSRHKDDFFARLKAFRANEAFDDFKIIAGNSIISANKMILAANSDYFKAMLSHVNRESDSNQVVLEDLSASTIELILDYCYSNQVELTESNVDEVEAAASRLVMLPLQECCKFWRSHDALIDHTLSKKKLETDRQTAREDIESERERFSTKIKALHLSEGELQEEMEDFEARIPEMLKDIDGKHDSKKEELDRKVLATVEELRLMV